MKVYSKPPIDPALALLEEMKLFLSSHFPN
jgi:hypothetical protein